MNEQPKNIKFFRDRIKGAYHIKIVNITVVLDEDKRLIHSHMEHPEPITRPVLMDLLQSLREQVINDYNKIEKSASSIENAEKILSIVSVPAHESNPSIGSEPE